MRMQPVSFLVSVIASAALAGHAGVGEAHADNIDVQQKNKAFSVKEIKAKLGDTIVFRNQELDITHNVYSFSPGNEFEIKSQRPGQSSDLKLEPGKHKKGRMEVECAIHPNMKLVVNIE